MPQFQVFIFVVLIIIVLSVLLMVFLNSKLSKITQELKSSEDKVLIEWLKEMKTSMENNTEVLDRELKGQRFSLEEQLKNQRTAMNQQTKLIWERLDTASEVIRTVQKQMGGIQEFGTDIKDLSNILKSPKMRGGLGEQFLYEILANSLPADLYKTQYKFKDGSTADAVVKTEKGLIPVDAKFPMENFKAMLTSDTPDLRDKFKKEFIKDVKKRIDEIAGKYILPDEGTTEMAVMYIPSENVYYELIVNTPEIEEYSKNKNVLMASPNSFSYLMKVLLVAYQQHEFAKHADEILKALAGIKIEAEKFDEELGVLDRHISNASKSMDNTRSRFNRLFNRIENAGSLGEAQQPTLLE